jgi:hypothetical protein
MPGDRNIRTLRRKMGEKEGKEECGCVSKKGVAVAFSCFMPPFLFLARDNLPRAPWIS